MPRKTTAGQIMTTRLVTLTPDMNVMQAVKLLLKHKISGASVIDEERMLVGILSELDCINHICSRIVEKLPPLNVGQLMTDVVQSVMPETSLMTLADILTTKRFRRVPVVDAAGRLVGQVSRHDVLWALDELTAVRELDVPGPLYLSALANEAPAKVSSLQRRPLA